MKSEIFLPLTSSIILLTALTNLFLQLRNSLKWTIRDRIVCIRSWKKHVQDCNLYDFTKHSWIDAGDVYLAELNGHVKVVYERDYKSRTIYRIINKTGQVFVEKFKN